MISAATAAVPSGASVTLTLNSPSNDAWSAKGPTATHLEAASVEVSLDGSGSMRGATETEQGFTVEAGTHPELEELELVGMVAEPTEVPQAEALLADAGVSGESGVVFRDPSVTQ